MTISLALGNFTLQIWVVSREIFRGLARCCWSPVMRNSVSLSWLFTMHVHVVTADQLNEHLLFWQPTISIILYVIIALYLVWYLRWE